MASDEIQPNRLSDEVAKRWLMSKAVIEQFITELVAPHVFSKEVLDINASALIARLAQHDPPLLICTPDEMKE